MTQNDPEPTKFWWRQAWQTLRRAGRDVYYYPALNWHWAAKTLPFRSPALLLLSYPRSGSSWIGQVLACSPDLAYLREPVTQPYLATFALSTAVESVFDPSLNHEEEMKYRRFAGSAFLGLPPRSLQNDVELDRRQFALLGRQHRRLLIKEVNPLAAPWYVQNFAPQILLLIRHPAALADSYLRAGWLKNELELFGRRYGWELQLALNAIRPLSLPILQFEQFALQPHQQFSQLYAALKVREPANFDKIIQSYCDTDRQATSMYDIRRASSLQVSKWRRNLSRSMVDQLRRGYEQSTLDFYRTDSDW